MFQHRIYTGCHCSFGTNERIGLYVCVVGIVVIICFLVQRCHFVCNCYDYYRTFPLCFVETGLMDHHYLPLSEMGIHHYCYCERIHSHPMFERRIQFESSKE